MKHYPVTGGWRGLLAAFLVLSAMAVPADVLRSHPGLVAERDPRQYSPGYYNGDSLPASTIYLTFDDGPGDFTAEILDILKAENLHATFFINSFNRNSRQPWLYKDNGLLPYGAVLRRMIAEGHAIGNHSFSHQNLAAGTVGFVDFQLDVLQAHFEQAYGPGAPYLWLIRPPFGSPWLGNWGSAAQKKLVSQELSGRGLVCMWTTGWDSADSAEWVKGEWFTVNSPRYHPGGLAYQAKMERGIKRVLKRADGLASGVLLLHDIHPTTRDSLRSLIQDLKARGYQFATLTEYARWRWGDGRVAAWSAGPVEGEAGIAAAGAAEAWPWGQAPP